MWTRSGLARPDHFNHVGANPGELQRPGSAVRAQAGEPVRRQERRRPSIELGLDQK
jgi:hypothetical protein